MIELPYKGGELAMVLIVPRTPTGLRALEARLTRTELDTWLEKLQRRTVETAVPRLTLECEYEMARPLETMGIRRAFVSPDQPAGAEFTGMSDSTDPTRQLRIGTVRHKAWVDITETGTEAAAATAFGAAPTKAHHRVEMVSFIPEFRADRPFLFLIRDTKSGLIIFIGRVTNP